MKRDRFQCTYCGAPGTDAELEVDHIIAVANGGSHHISNLTTSCRACNQKKGSGEAPARLMGRSNTQTGLAGLWFHTFKEGAVQWQGQILSIDGDVALLQLYEWFFGDKGSIKAVQKAFLYSDDCRLYPTNEHMIEAYRQIEREREREALLSA